TSLSPACLVSFNAILHLPPRSTLFPYTTLFRSVIIRPPTIAATPIAVLDSKVRWSVAVSITAPMELTTVCTEVDVPANLIKLLRSEEHTSELQSRFDLVCRLLLEKKYNNHFSTL